MENLNDKLKKVMIKYESDFNLITMAFINFFGLQHREYILRKLNNSRIVWFDDTVDRENSDISDCIISSIHKEEIDEILSKRNKNAFLQSAYIDEFDLLVLPLSYDLTQIIHENNHKIGSHIISRKPLIFINGLSYAEVGSLGAIIYDEYLMEVINQKMTLDIIDELNQLGLEVRKTSSWQEHLFPLINLFYETFKDLLKETHISGDLSTFKKTLGEDNYNYFSQMIHLKGFKLIRDLNRGREPSISQEVIDEVEEIVIKMKNNYDNVNSQNGSKCKK